MTTRCIVSSVIKYKCDNCNSEINPRDYEWAQIFLRKGSVVLRVQGLIVREEEGKEKWVNPSGEDGEGLHICTPCIVNVAREGDPTVWQRSDG